VIGYVLLALPFVVITAGMILSGGWLRAAAVWGTVLAIVVVVVIGVRLVNDD
jgi:hypothetical protein